MPLLSKGLCPPKLFLLLLDQDRDTAINLIQRSQSGSLRTCLDFRSNAPDVGHGVACLLYTSDAADDM
eukprot:13631629-Alexandrium_andersonii.AAC.1